MAKLQLTPDWLIVAIGSIWYLSQGGLTVEIEHTNETVEAEDSTALVYVDINTTATADGSNASTVELINESDSTTVDTRELTLKGSEGVSTEFYRTSST